jgi:hypothetical protein
MSQNRAAPWGIMLRIEVAASEAAQCRCKAARRSTSPEIRLLGVEGDHPRTRFRKSSPRRSPAASMLWASPGEA